LPLVTWYLQHLRTDTLISGPLITDNRVHSVLQVALVFALELGDDGHQLLAFVALESGQAEAQLKGFQRRSEGQRGERFMGGGNMGVLHLFPVLIIIVIEGF
jgi:hypothetical protein